MAVDDASLKGGSKEEMEVKDGCRDAWGQRTHSEWAPCSGPLSTALAPTTALVPILTCLTAHLGRDHPPVPRSDRVMCPDGT